jgi:drug/metabolite transporter (DMT)-like permease
LKVQGVEEKTINLIKLSFVSLFMGLVLPATTGSDTLRIVFIERHHKSFKGKGVASVIIERLIGFFLLAIFGFTGSFFVFSNTGIAQIILKRGANKKANSKVLNFFINPYTISGYFLMFSVTLINLFIFKHLDLKFAIVFLPSTFILVLLLSKLILKEKLSKKNLLSYIMIISGIIIFNLSF